MKRTYAIAGIYLMRTALRSGSVQLDSAFMTKSRNSDGSSAVAATYAVWSSIAQQLTCAEYRKALLMTGRRNRYIDSLWAAWYGDRIPTGVRFFAPAQTDPGAHPASYTMDTGSFTQGKAAGAWR